MKILYLADIRLPTERAHGLQIMKTCEALAELGAQLELAVPTRARNTVREDPFAYYAVKKTFTVTRIRVPDLIHFGQAGVLVALLVFSERARWLRSFWRADVIYSRDHLMLLQYLLLGRHLVFEAHAPPTFFSRFVARHVAHVVVISKALRQAYQVAGILPERITLAPDAVDLTAFDIALSREEARKELHLPLDKKIVAYVGHLYERKGAHTLAEAAQQVPEATFVFVGGTPTDIKGFTTIYGSAINLRIEGYVEPAKVPLYLRAADVLVIPNSAKDADSARYSSPMKLFEYMASGTPILAAEVPALREVLTDVTATFFAPDDPQALAAVIAHAFTDPSNAARAKAAHAAAAAYTWECRAEALLSFMNVLSQTLTKRKKELK